MRKSVQNATLNSALEEYLDDNLQIGHVIREELPLRIITAQDVFVKLDQEEKKVEIFAFFSIFQTRLAARMISQASTSSCSEVSKHFPNSSPLPPQLYLKDFLRIKGFKIH